MRAPRPAHRPAADPDDGGVIAARAEAIARALALRDGEGEPLAFAGARTPARARAHLLDALRGCRPARGAPAVGQVIDALLAHVAARAPRDRARRDVAELFELVAQGGHRRTKRAERERLFAHLLALFGLDAALGFPPTGEDPLKTTHAVEAWIREGR